MFIDVHAHLYDEKFGDKIDEVVSRAKEYGVEKIICAASDIEKSKRSIELAERFKEVYATVGIHPEDCIDFCMEDIEKLREFAKHKKVVAIGEIGLDYYWKEVPKEKQKEAFLEQIKLASELKLPVVLHVREATGDVLEILEKNKQYIENGGIVHCFNKNYEVAKRFMNLGFSFSIGGSLTFPNTEKLQDAIRQIPLDKLMLETDCPYMAPVPLRGTINEPRNVVIVAENIAKIKGIDVGDVKKETTKNALKLFKIEE